MRKKDEIILALGRDEASSEMLNLEVLIDLRDQLERIAEAIEYARKSLERWERSPA